MKVLIVSSFLPYPLFSGGHVRLFNIIKELAKRHELTLVCEIRDHQTTEDIREVEKFCKKVITVKRKKQWSLENIFKSGFSFYPFLLVGHSQKNFQEEIKKILSEEKFDVIHIETFYVMHNLPKNVFVPTVLVEHNIEYLVYKRYLNNVLYALRPFLFLDIAKIKYWEKFFWKKATKLVAVSNEEKDFMNRSDVVVVPNGVDTEKFQISNFKSKILKEEKRILFIGDFKWIQNKDAISWILKEIWPKINSKLSAKGQSGSGRKTQNIKLILWVVGRNIPESIRKLTNDENVVFDENAPKETEDIFAKADLLLAPIRVGGGTSFKILESMACGVPVVTTPLGKEGIDAKDKEEILIAENTEEFTDIIFNILDDEKLYKKIAQNARKLIEDKYDWKIIVKELEKVYNLAIK